MLNHLCFPCSSFGSNLQVWLHCGTLCLFNDLMAMKQPKGIGDPTQPDIGDYYLTNPWGCSVCRAYDMPPSLRGKKICTIAKGTYLGPVTTVESTKDFVTIEVRGYWINIFAKKTMPILPAVFHRLAFSVGFTAAGTTNKAFNRQGAACTWPMHVFAFWAMIGKE